MEFSCTFPRKSRYILESTDFKDFSPGSRKTVISRRASEFRNCNEALKNDPFVFVSILDNEFWTAHLLDVLSERYVMLGELIAVSIYFYF